MNTGIIMASLIEETNRLKMENLELRKIWWMNHGCPISALYGDDGELQCSFCLVDFKRETVSEIQDKFWKKNHEIWEKQYKNGDSGKKE